MTWRFVVASVPVPGESIRWRIRGLEREIRSSIPAFCPQRGRLLADHGGDAEDARGRRRRDRRRPTVRRGLVPAVVRVLRRRSRSGRAVGARVQAGATLYEARLLRQLPEADGRTRNGPMPMAKVVPGRPRTVHVVARTASTACLPARVPEAAEEIRGCSVARRDRAAGLQDSRAPSKLICQNVSPRPLCGPGRYLQRIASGLMRTAGCSVVARAYRGRSQRPPPAGPGPPRAGDSARSNRCTQRRHGEGGPLRQEARPSREGGADAKRHAEQAPD